MIGVGATKLSQSDGEDATGVGVVGQGLCFGVHVLSFLPYLRSSVCSSNNHRRNHHRRRLDERPPYGFLA